MDIRVCNTIAKKPSWISKIIKWWEKTPYSHTMVIINDTVYEAVKNGFLPMPLDEWLKEDKILMECDCVRKFNISNDKQEEILNKAETMVGTKYGTMTLLGCALNDLFGISWFADGRKTLICSESVYYLFEEFLPPINELPDFVSPKDIEKLFFN